MKKINYILFALMIVSVMGCDKDKFGDLNTDPATLSEPDLRYSLTKEIEAMYNNDYTIWFYNNLQYQWPWSQVATQNGGNPNDFNLMGSTGGQSLFGDLLRQARDIQYRIDHMEPENKAYWEPLKAISYAALIQPYITVTDVNGSQAYNEAGRAAFTDPPLITPVLDNLETLYSTWLEELDYAIGVLSNVPQDAVPFAEQDLIYGGDYTKWAKFCNLLKLKIAARLINKDRDKAIQIAEQVASSPIGYMSTNEDDFVYRRGKLWLGTTNGLEGGFAAKRLAEFMVNNRDPRIRFIFRKNDFNPEVIQAFIDEGRKDDLPSYIVPNILFDGNGNFAGWKDGIGEPWVRYYGAPVSPSELGNDEYFNQESLYQLTIDDNTKSYYATSYFNEKFLRTSYGFTYPTKPGGRVIELRYNEPPLKVIIGTAAETLLFLAEFKLLGANIPVDAQELFNEGVKLSILGADEVAKNNELPYYDEDPVYLTIDERYNASTKVKPGEIATLLSKDICNLSSGDALEKVYIQQLINYALTPYDVWTTARRAGIPKRDSHYLAWEPFMPRGGGSEIVIPRRFTAGLPLEDDLNYANKMAALQEQGFTPGSNDPNILHDERLWFDKENPDYGMGPKN